MKDVHRNSTAISEYHYCIYGMMKTFVKAQCSNSCIPNFICTRPTVATLISFCLHPAMCFIFSVFFTNLSFQNSRI